MNSHSSIVKSLIFRSIAGQKLWVDVHQHLSMDIHLCWYTIIEPGYYKNCIVRRISTFREYNESVTSIRRSSKFDGACLCCYGSVFTMQRKKPKRCIYTDGRGSTSLLSSKDYYKLLKYGRFTCLCPVAFSVEIGRHITE